MKLTYSTTVVMHALANGVRHGFDVIDATELPSGTVYPILVSAQWEDVTIAQKEHRPPRRYYELTATGRQVLETASARYRLPRTIAARIRRLRPA